MKYAQCVCCKIKIIFKKMNLHGVTEKNIDENNSLNQFLHTFNRLPAIRPQADSLIIDVPNLKLFH